LLLNHTCDNNIDTVITVQYCLQAVLPLMHPQRVRLESTSPTLWWSRRFFLSDLRFCGSLLQSKGPPEIRPEVANAYVYYNKLRSHPNAEALVG
jgi:hypothetical protein